MPNMLRRVFAAALFAALACFPAPDRAIANPLYAQETGQPCETCHRPGQELRGPSGLNPTGVAFCQQTPGCNLNPVPQARRTTQSEGGTATFDQRDCGGRPRFITLRLGNAIPVGIVLDPGMHVHVVVAQGSSFAAQCGNYPPDSASYSYINLD